MAGWRPPPERKVYFQLFPMDLESHIGSVIRSEETKKDRIMRYRKCRIKNDLTCW